MPSLMINVSADEIPARDTTHRLTAAAMTILLMRHFLLESRLGGPLRQGDRRDDRRAIVRARYVPDCTPTASSWECNNAVARSLVEPIERPVTEECSYVIAIVIVTPFCSSSC